MKSSNTHVKHPPSRKATLYCPGCTHADRIDGGWILHVDATHRRYECPECGETIDSRPNEPEPTNERGGVLRIGNAD